MSHAMTTEWDGWLRAGMDELRRMDDTGWADQFVNAPLWFFIARLDASVSPVMGALAPSMDRVGRYYPLTVMATAPHADWPLADDSCVNAFLAGARATIVEARRQSMPVEEMDWRINQLPSPFHHSPSKGHEASLVGNILSDLDEASRIHQSMAGTPAENALLPPCDWRDHVAEFHAQSFWWVASPSRMGYQELLHQGACDRRLFAQLFSRHRPSPANAG